ncbi:MAG TPA: HAMP domain-containing protein, partial [Desulfosarcina sp.]|nr:HAMP domain-containing protein [Desulfosarcina sp.]
MQPLPFKTLRSRLAVMLISPVVLILLAAGAFGFIYARDVVLGQWNQSVTHQLQRAAHEVEMRLSKPLELMDMFSKGGSGAADAALLEAIIDKLEILPGVARVKLTWHAPVAGSRHGRNRGMEMGMGRFMPFHRGAFASISPPIVDNTTGGQTVSLTMVLLDVDDVPVGNLEIVLRFEHLVADIAANVWWRNTRACIAERASGDLVLASGLMQGRTRLGENGDELELAVKAAIDGQSSGTRWGPGLPPRQVAGFHTLDTFPWSLVVFADGRKILAPIIRFRNGFIIGALVLVGAVYAIIRLNVDRTSAVIRNLSQRAITVAAGDYNEKIAVRTKDEIGRLAASFNAMIDGLKERDTIRNTFGRYVDPDFARELLDRPEAGRLGGRRKAVVILMADIRGFTPMAEKMSPETTIEVLNRYFSSIIPLIQKRRGIIVDFVGDGILAFFEPLQDSLEATAGRCVQCAFDMHDAMRQLNRH